MAVKRHGVHFDVTAENSADRALRAVEDNLKGINRAAEAVGRTLQGAFIATAAIAAGKAFAHAAIEAEQASLRLDAVLKATGHSAGLTKEQLDGMADALAESTKFDDESLRNAEAQLLKFGNIHGDTFRTAIKLSADLAAFMGTDLESAVQAVGKALTSPTEGMRALERQVGKFSPAARQMIQDLVEGGQEAKAQGLVLDLLKGKIGGAAEALNSGLAKSTGNVTKQWNEMLEAIGKSEPFQKAAKAGLGMVEQAFRDIKEIVENGTWYEKTIALLAFQYGFHGFKLTPAAPDARNTVSGKIGGVVDPRKMDEGMPPVSETTWKDWKAYFEFLDKKRAEAKQKKEQDLREQGEAAVKLATFEADVQKGANDATNDFYRTRGEQRAKDEEEQAKASQRLSDIMNASYVEAAEMSVQAADSMVYAWDAAGKRIEIARDKFDQLASAAKKTDDVTREFAVTIFSAFEDAILQGKKLDEVLRSLALGLGRLVLRKTVTEPLETAVSNSIKSSGFGDWFSGLFKAEGGPVYAGDPYIVGEQGPEMFVPQASGSIVPNRALGGSNGARGGDLYVTINAPGADAAALARVQVSIMQLKASFDARAVSAVARAFNRRGVSTALG
jgi:hypothetical protein